MKKYALIFPGQSSQKLGMLQELYSESILVRRVFEEASDIIGFDISKICFKGEIQELSDIAISAAVILTANVASFRHFSEQFETPPAFMAGHSLGEYAALTCAGVFTLEQALPLVTYRSKLAQRMIAEHEGIMTVIFNITYTEIEELCKQMRKRGYRVWVSCYNSVNQVCVGGRESDVNLLELKALRAGASCKRIIGNAPFHTPMMNDVVEELADFLRNCNINESIYPVISNISLKPYTLYSVMDNLLQQLIYPIRWFQTIQYIIRQNTHTFIELGSGQTFTQLIKATETDVQPFNYENAGDRKLLTNYFQEKLVV